jgi:hypothetical protein
MNVANYALRKQWKTIPVQREVGGLLSSIQLYRVKWQWLLIQRGRYRIYQENDPIDDVFVMRTASWLSAYDTRWKKVAFKSAAEADCFRQSVVAALTDNKQLRKLADQMTFPRTCKYLGFRRALLAYEIFTIRCDCTCMHRRWVLYVRLKICPFGDEC